LWEFGTPVGLNHGLASERSRRELLLLGDP